MHKRSNDGSDYRSLLDRLTDTTASEIAAVTLAAGEMPCDDIEDSILRDLTWLLGTTAFSASRDIDQWRNIQQSVLNFGIPSLIGLSSKGVDLAWVERRVAEAIRRFEPRFRSDSIQVTAIVADPDTHQHCIELSIQAEYANAGRWIPLCMSANIDSESGRLESLQAQ
jgi:type VI secretion system protein ImpF